MKKRPGGHRHCEVARVRLRCTSYLNRSNLLDAGNSAKKDCGKGGTVLRGMVLAYRRLHRRSRRRGVPGKVSLCGFASQ